MLEIKFKTDNAAFHDCENDEFDAECERCECARLLKEIAEALERGYTSGPVMDINGNHVGAWSLK